MYTPAEIAHLNHRAATAHAALAAKTDPNAHERAALRAFTGTDAHLAALYPTSLHDHLPAIWKLISQPTVCAQVEPLLKERRFENALLVLPDTAAVIGRKSLNEAGFGASSNQFVWHTLRLLEYEWAGLLTFLQLVATTADLAPAATGFNARAGETHAEVSWRFLIAWFDEAEDTAQQLTALLPQRASSPVLDSAHDSRGT